MPPRMLTEVDWDLLIGRIRDGKCTPFLGAGASVGVIPLAGTIARQWADKYDYPLPDRSNLIQVAQFLAVQAQESTFPKTQLKRLIGNATPDFNRATEIHSVLARLPLPIYITTNYDDFMFQALSLAEKKPVAELCRWNKRLADSTMVSAETRRSAFDEGSEFMPTPETPVVFHLHGSFLEPDSMVLTEDDYLDFLINVGDDRRLLPHPIEKAFVQTSLLFLGYRLADANFRVVFRSLVNYLQRNFTRAHVSVQLAPDGLSNDQRDKALAYLDSYFKELKIRVYWGTCEEFAEDLTQRMGA
jgi:SIR2-like protein